MTTVRLLPHAWSDLTRITDHLAAHEVADVGSRIAEILDALQILASHPYIGRRIGPDLRELVIGRGARGYVALYAFDEDRDVIVVIAVRAQKEAGYRLN